LFGRSKHDSFVDILNKVNGKIEGWRSKTLSKAGRQVSSDQGGSFYYSVLCYELFLTFK